jgi:vacuolar-type H+-ATPase catalytic subunit A/Vma1
MGLWYTDTMMRRETMDLEQMIEYVRQTWFEDVMQDRDRIMEIVANVIDEDLAQFSEDEIIEEYKFLTGLDG